MNKLLDLATGFEESSRQQLKNSNEALRIALQEHETFMGSPQKTEFKVR